MQLKQIAADTRDPIATIAFSVLGIGGALGLIPADLDANTLAEILGFLMAALAAAFSLLHHKSVKPALAAAREAQERAGAPAALLDDQKTPIDPIEGDGG
jgi:hypothetical protein